MNPISFKTIIHGLIASTLGISPTWAMENTALTPKPYNHCFFATLKPQDFEIPNDDRFLDDNDDSKNRCCSNWLTLPSVADALKTLLDCVDQIRRDPPEIETTVDEAAMTVEMLRIDGELLSSNDRQANLSYRNLTVLPPEVGKLTSLTQLNISNNQLISLPSEFSNLTALTQLNISNNQLISLPSEFSNLTVLSNLTLCGNPLEGFASQINIKFQMIDRCLDLTDRGLRIIPPVVNKLASLTDLNLSGNQLTTVPAEIGNLRALKYLYLEINQLTTVPPEVGKLTSLTQLNISNNQLTSLPSEFSNLTALRYLSLHNNLLSTVPAEIGKLTALWALSLHNNQLTTLPAEIGKLTDLEFLHLGHNQLTTVPAQIGNLTDLQILHLTGNRLAGLESKWAKELKGAKLGVNQKLNEFRSYCSTKKDLEIKTMMMLLANQHDNHSSLADLPVEIVKLISNMHINYRLG